MSEPNRIAQLREIAPNYDAMLCDAWGVIHNGVELAPGAAEAMTTFRRERGPIIVLTNAPRPSAIIPPQLDRLGLPREAYDSVVTSGDATRHAIAERLPKPAFRIGPAKDDPLFEGMAVDFRPLEEAQFIICTGLADDQRETPEDYREILQAAAARGLEMVCANPDIVVNWGGRMIWCAGALAEIYAALGGAVIYGGKPHAPIYGLAFEAIKAARGGEIDRRRVLVVGDGLKTDILGANKMNLDALLVTGAGGIIEDDEALGRQLADAGLKILGATEAMRW